MIVILDRNTLDVTAGISNAKQEPVGNQGHLQLRGTRHRQGKFSDLNQASASCRLRNRLAMTAKRLNVQTNGPLDELFDLFPGVAAGDTTGQIGHISAIASVGRLLDHDCVFPDGTHFKPACLRMLLSVPAGTSLASLPPGSQFKRLRSMTS